MLEDTFGRRFHYLRLSITDVCNFRCSYCLPDGYQCDSDRDFLSLSEIKTIAQAFAELGTSKIRLTGGEPSLRKDLPDIIATCAQTPGIDNVVITTNGYRFPDVIDEWQDAGIGGINVSIDSLDPNVFNAITGADKLKAILAGVEKAASLGIPVKINSVLMKGVNEQSLKQFQAWLKDTSVTLRFIELMETGLSHQFFKQHHVPGEPLKQQLLQEGWTRIVRGKSAGPAQEFQHPDYAGRIGLIMPYSKDFCDSCNRLRISATGKLHLCLFAEQGLSLREEIASGDQLALQHKISTMLNDKEVSHWLQDGFTGATKNLAMLGG
ncbi:GTP 3',8-cyclase MoaA [Planctobacterium marinum]|uniref:GTP 3',8-cyclase MoaA n=1 Tax=Planctobacterium marinum TaxID=1631968 RepID=UPI001E386891|nr:GTP 3',8-cyclase MoaA [Planctobacterium marinum]MCC2603881.1 GTP 3',8-cyclase MoaA [Planctobacterium marinum]